MKKKHYLLIICFSISLLTFAQESKHKVDYGLKAGLNYASLIYEFQDVNNDLFDFNSSVGFYMGGFINLSFTDKLSLQPELMYSSQGAKVDVDYSRLIFFSDSNIFLENQEGVVIKQSKILFPILLQYQAIEKIKVSLGPQITYLLNFEDEIENGQEINIIRFNDTDKVGIDITARFGYQVSDNVLLELGYFRGLNYQNSVASSVFQLGLAYKL